MDGTHGGQFSISHLPELLKNNSAWMGMQAVAIVYTTSKFLSIQPNLALLIGPLTVIGVYGINDVSDYGEDLINQPYRTSRQYGRYRSNFAFYAFLYLAGVGLAVYSGHQAAILLVLLPALSLLLYSFAPVPTMKRLKRVFILNTALISLTWAGITYLPVTLAPGVESSLLVVLLFGFWFLRVVVGVEVCNIPDAKGDRQNEIATLPVKLGIQNTKYVVYAIDVISILLLVLIQMLTKPAVSPFIAAPAIGYSAVIAHFAGQRFSYQTACFVIDSHVFLIAASVFVYSIITGV